MQTVKISEVPKSGRQFSDGLDISMYVKWKNEGYARLPSPLANIALKLGQ